VSGNIEIIFNPSRPDNSLDELCSMLQHRADQINENLDSHFTYAPVAEYLKRFNELHKTHLLALREGKLIVAHEILLQIHELSFELSRNEFWSRSHARLGNKIRYSLGLDAFENGPLISSYITSPFRQSEKFKRGKSVRTPHSIALIYTDFLAQKS
jgi:hypothetical protein